MTITTIDIITRSSAAALISGYQKHISPRKGICCAYRILRGGESCSAYVKRAILERGLLEGMQISRQRFQACKAANQILRNRIQARNSSHKAEQEQPEEKQEEKQQRRTNETDQCNDAVNCTDCGCQSLECMGVEWPECGVPDFCGIDCCNGADFCSCGG